MANARGLIEAEVAGQKRRLRLSLDAIAEFEDLTGRGLFEIAAEWKGGRQPSVAHLVCLFAVACRAGGTPLTDEERAELDLGDLPAIAEAIKKAMEASGIISSEKKRPTAKVSAKPSIPLKRPGGSGRR